MPEMWSPVWLMRSDTPSGDRGAGAANVIHSRVDTVDANATRERKRWVYLIAARRSS
jgi:hypothetical protein